METKPDKKDEKQVKRSDDGRLEQKREQKNDSDPSVDPSVRAVREDDDGYDPYSDRRETEQLFERDPWR